MISKIENSLKFEGPRAISGIPLREIDADSDADSGQCTKAAANIRIALRQSIRPLLAVAAINRYIR